MIDPKSDDDVLLTAVKRALRIDEAHWQDSYEEMREAVRFRHNTDGTGQWEPKALSVLRAQGRPCFTMNVIAHKIESVVGMNEENKLAVCAEPVGDADRPTADLVNAVLEAGARQGALAEIERECFENAVTIGESDLAYDVKRDPENPRFLTEVFTPILPTDIAWDAASERRDRSDARHLAWSRWMDKAEFKNEYPEHATEAEELFSADGHEQGLPGARSDILDGDDYEHRREQRIGEFLDRRRGELRVVHSEWRIPTRVDLALMRDPALEPIEISADEAAVMRGASQLPPDIEEIVSVTRDHIYWVEYITSRILWRGDAPVPFDGFSVIPLACYVDPDTGYRYGLVRHLRDPQKDVNKAFSMSIEHVANNVKVGYIAEEGAIPDVKKFDDANAAGETSIVANGALTATRIQKREPSPYSQAVDTRLERALSLMDLISGIQMAAESPSKAAEAATTVMLRDKKALRAMVQPMKNFVRFQQMLAEKRLATVANAMSTAQIVEQAGNARWAVDPQSGAVADFEKQERLDLKSLRTLSLSIGFEPISPGDVQRINTLGLLLQAAQLPNVPMDPELLYAYMPFSRAEFEQAKAYAKSAQEGQSQAAKADMEMAQTQLAQQAAKDQGKLQIEAGKVSETSRTNQANEQISLLAILEKADANEKKLILDAYTARIQAQTQRESAAQRPSAT